MSEELKPMAPRLKQTQTREAKHDADCDCGICQYCNGTEDVYGNSTAPIKIANLEAELAALKAKLDAAKKSMIYAIRETCDIRQAIRDGKATDLVIIENSFYVIEDGLGETLAIINGKEGKDE